MWERIGEGRLFRSRRVDRWGIVNRDSGRRLGDIYYLLFILTLLLHYMLRFSPLMGFNISFLMFVIVE